MKIDLEAVTKKYGKDGNEKCVLDHVSLSVGKGEMVAICGKSGAGKSTLLHLIGLLDAPTSGTISFDGQNITATKSDRELSKIRNEKIGFVLQDFGLIEDESVYNNVSLPLMFGKAKLTSIDERVQDVLAKVGMDPFVKTGVSILSGGEKQRVAIARALINAPELILADEPTGALDTENAGIVMDIFEKIHKERVTIIIVTHDEDVARRCDRIIRIADGKLCS